MKDTLEIIRAACIKTNPSIMEPGFGCDVIVKGIDFAPQTISQTFHSKEITWELSGRNGMEIKREDIIEILGRPIRLADVLLAIYRSGGVPHKEGTAPGENYWKAIIDVVANAKKGWNLLKDDLREQSEECLAFLASLLK